MNSHPKYEDYIVKMVLPEDEEGETDVLTSISLTLWDFFFSLLSTGENTYDKLKVPVGVALFGRPLPPYRIAKSKVNKWLTEGKLPLFGALFLVKNPERMKEGEGHMKVSWRKVEEKIGKSVELRRRRGSGNVTHSLDLYNSHWEVELKVRSPGKTNPLLKLYTTKIYDLIGRGMMRHKMPAILLEVSTSPPRHYIIIPVDMVSNRDVYKVLGVNLKETPHVESPSSLSLNWKDDDLSVMGVKPPVVVKVANSMKFLVAETSLETAKETFKLNPLEER